MSCDGLTLGKIIFGYTPRVVLPPQQPFLNATMEQVQRWGEDVSNDGLDAMSAHYKSHAIFRPSTPSRQISKCMFLFEQSYMHI
jgi:hypothetical protein